jgi:hypothetical protein
MPDDFEIGSANKTFLSKLFFKKISATLAA